MCKPLFIPLMTEHFEAFKSGKKRHELRLYGARWNENTCQVGRKATLSKGYGNYERLQGKVSSFTTARFQDLPSKEKKDFITCYGEEKTHPVIAVIGIEVERP